MQKKTLLPLILILSLFLVLAACVRPVTTPPTATPAGTDLLDELLGTASPNTPQPTDTVAVPDTPTPTTEAVPTEEPPTATVPAPTNTIQIITPTSPPPTDEPQPTTEDGTPAATDEEPSETVPAVTAKPTRTLTASQINPDQAFNGKRIVDSMDEPQVWYDESGELPDSEYLKMEFRNSKMFVTGKLQEWDTWWISGNTLTDFYIEMEVNSGACEGADAYGMILRASAHGEPTHGYLIGFTCDGKIFAKRLVATTPYTAISILNPTESDLIYAGKNRINILGVKMVGNTIEIYPNRAYFTTIVDNTFAYGRFGIFVKAGPTENYTYSVNEIRIWGIIQ